MTAPISSDRATVPQGPAGGTKTTMGSGEQAATGQDAPLKFVRFYCVDCPGCFRCMPDSWTGGWKVGNEFLPFHPSASHVPPDYRDGWNACYRAWNRRPSSGLREAAIQAIEALAFIGEREDLTFTECSLAEEICDRAKVALAALRAAVGEATP